MQLRERATAVLTAASILVPVAALAIGHGHAGASIPFGVAAVAYAACVRECGAALLPRGVHVGLLGGELLDTANASGADLREMQATAADYLDENYKHNEYILERAGARITRAVTALTVEILALTSALIVTVVG